MNSVPRGRLIFLKAKHEEWKVVLTDKCSLLLQAIFEAKKERRQDVHLGLSGDLNLDPPERQFTVC